MIRKVEEKNIEIPSVKIGASAFPAPFYSGLEYSSPARGTWNIVHTGMLIPEAHEIFVCAASCLRGVVLTAYEMCAENRFSTVAVEEKNLIEGNMEDLIIDGVSHIIDTLPKRPPCVLVYTSCVHHFCGCDLDMVYTRLRQSYPDIDFTDCYMNPIMRKSGRTPDQIMRSRLYSLLKPAEILPGSVAFIGNDFPEHHNGFHIWSLPTMRASYLLPISSNSASVSTRRVLGKTSEKCTMLNRTYVFNFFLI